MIKGDIDLTEDLDFRIDKKLPSVVYNNDPNIIPSKSSKVDYVEDFHLSNYNLNIYHSARNYYYSIGGVSSTTSTFTYDEQFEDILYFNYNYMVEDLLDYIRYPSSTRLPYKTIISEPIKKLNSAEKLFGSKRNINRLFTNLGTKRNKGYSNDKIFMQSTACKEKIKSISIKKHNQLKRLKILSRIWSYENYSDNSLSPEIEYLFGVKKKPKKSSDSHLKGFDRVPWIKDLKSRNKNAYEYYIEELKEVEKDYSKYLTDLHWLRIYN